MSHVLSRRHIIEVLAATPFATAFPALARPAVASARSLGFSDKRLKLMDAEFHALVDQQKLAGVVTLVARHGKVAHIDAYGRLNANEAAPVKLDSIFRIASMTKPTIGVAMMMLWEEGKWAFDDPVAKHIPEFAGLKVRDLSGALVEQQSPMLMKQLVSHSAGFDRSAAYANDRLQETDLQGMIDKLSKLPLAFQAGTDWRYGPSVDIQGYVVQKLSGQRLDQFMQNRLFGPLGMVDTGFFVDPSKVDRCTSIHVYKDGKVTPQSPTNSVRTSAPRFLSGSGGLFSTAPDYLRFCQMLLNGGHSAGKRYLKPDTVRLMHANLLNPAVNVTLYSPDTRGLGFGVDFAIVMDQAANHTSQAQDSYYWGGAYGTWFWIDPDHDIVFVWRWHENRAMDGMVQRIMAAVTGD